MKVHNSFELRIHHPGRTGIYWVGLIKSSKCFYRKSVMYLFRPLLCKLQVKSVTALYSHPLGGIRSNLVDAVKRYRQNGHSPAYVLWCEKCTQNASSCPNNVIRSPLILIGFAGGSHWTQVGGASDIICLSDKPKYAKYTTAHDDTAFIYGVELELIESTGGIFDTTNALPNALMNSDVQCAVCRSRSRTSTVCCCE
jgi:hypothetical protein